MAIGLMSSEPCLLRWVYSLINDGILIVLNFSGSIISELSEGLIISEKTYESGLRTYGTVYFYFFFFSVYGIASIADFIYTGYALK